jgi:cytoskeletal protein CcmA (bactofilin family)
MFKRGTQDSIGNIDTLIGRSTGIQGDVEFAGGLHIDGRVMGSVRGVAGASAVISVSEHGVIEGSIEATQIVLNGAVHGDIHGSERVVLGSKARVQGNVHYGAIEMELGAVIHGKLVPRSDEEAAPPSVHNPA